MWEPSFLADFPPSGGNNTKNPILEQTGHEDAQATLLYCFAVGAFTVNTGLRHPPDVRTEEY